MRIVTSTSHTLVVRIYIPWVAHGFILAISLSGILSVLSWTVFTRPGHSWITIADTLGVGKQTLTGFRKRRAPALDAEALIRLCTAWKVPLTYQDQTIRCVTEDAQREASAVLQLQMEFDDSFELRADPTPRAILTRKPPSRVSYIGVRIEQVEKKSGPPAA